MVNKKMVNKPLAAIAIGFLRYSKALSRKAWMKLMNINEKKMKEAEVALPTAFKAIDKAWKRGIIKKNNAARKKSRLAKMINKRI